MRGKIFKSGTLLAISLLLGLICLAHGQVAADGPSSQKPSPNDPLLANAIARLGSNRLRHSGGVVDGVFSPDGKTLISSGQDSTIRAWEVATGHFRWVYQLKGRQAGTVRYSSDGKSILAITGASLERLDAASGRLLGTVVTHPTKISSFHISHDGKLVATVSCGFQCPTVIKVSELATGREIFKRTPDEKNFILRYDLHVDFSLDDGFFLLTAGDKRIEAWQLVDQKLAYALNGEGEYASFDAVWHITADGTGVAFQHGEDKHDIVGWEMATGNEQYRIPAMGRMLRITPNEKSFLVTGKGKATEEYDVTSGKLIRTIADSNSIFRAISPDNKTLLFEQTLEAQKSGKVTLLKHGTGQPFAEFPLSQIYPWQSSEYRYRFSPDNRALAMIRDGKATWGCGEGNSVFFGDSHTGRLQLRSVTSGAVLAEREYPRGGWPEHTSINWDYSPVGHYAVSWGPWPTLRIWDTQTGKEITGYDGHDGGIRAGLWSPDGKIIFTHDDTDTVLAWDVATGRVLWEVPRSRLSILAISLSPDGRSLAILEELDHWVEVVTVWDVSTRKRRGRVARKFNHGVQRGGDPTLHNMRFLANGMLQVVGDDDKRIAIWNIDVSKLTGQESGITESKKEIDLTDTIPLDSLSKPKEIAPLNDYTTSLVPCCNGERLIQVYLQDRDCQLRVFDTTTRRVVFQLTKSSKVKEKAQIAIASSGQEIAFIASEDLGDTVEWWNIATGKWKHKLTRWKGPVGAIAFSPDGRYLATGSAKEVVSDPEDPKEPTGAVVRSEICLWDSVSGAELCRIPAHAGAIRSLTFSTDGKRLLSGSADTTVLVWDVARLLTVK